jgi:hypothetical protein
VSAPVTLLKPEYKGELAGWLALHRDHSRCGPFRDTKIGEWDLWRCSCGSRFYRVNAAVQDFGEQAVGESRP